MPPFRGAAQPRAAIVLVTLLATACRDSAAPAAVPASIAVASAGIATADVGATLAISPSIVVRDGTGKAIGGLPVAIVVGEGGGVLRNPATRTAAGPTSVGLWTMGTRAGRNTLVVSADKLPPFIVEAVASPGAPAEIRVVAGDNQVALAGDPLPASIAVQVVDRFGNPVPQQVVRFDALAGGGIVEPSSVTTGADGVAGGVRWQLGARSSVQSVRALVAPLVIEIPSRALSDFTIDVRFAGTPPSVLFQDAFRNAAERIRTAVIGDLPDVPVQALNVGSCGGGTGATLTETIDDIIIFASVSPIDGVGKVLARAGPCFVRNSTLQPLVGSMQFDDADALTLLNSDRFESVVLHEMLHIVGIGSLWRLKNLVDSLGTSDPRYIGAIGIGRCVLIGFGSQCVRGVPVENTGGSGTAGVHWRESIFDRELMTGFAESTPDMPFSVLTLGSLADYGYQVNEKAADPFHFSAARVTPRALPSVAAPWEDVFEPTHEVSRVGLARRLPSSPSPRTPRR